MNYEDDELQKFGEKTAAQVLYFSSARKLEKGIYLDGTKIICAADVPVELCDVSELKILGTHNYENVMAASAMAYAYGVPIEVPAGAHLVRSSQKMPPPCIGGIPSYA